jgi:hypothetical protein
MNNSTETFFSGVIIGVIGLAALLFLQTIPQAKHNEGFIKRRSLLDMESGLLIQIHRTVVSLQSQPFNGLPITFNQNE